MATIEVYDKRAVLITRLRDIDERHLQAPFIRIAVAEPFSLEFDPKVDCSNLTVDQITLVRREANSGPFWELDDKDHPLFKKHIENTKQNKRIRLD